MSMYCPLCGGSNCSSVANQQDDSILYNCNVFNRKFKIGFPLENCEGTLQRKLRNLVFEYVMHMPYFGLHRTYWLFYYDTHDQTMDGDDSSFKVNLAKLNYPNTISEKNDRVLLNLYRINPEFGGIFTTDLKYARAFFSETEKEDNLFGFERIMEELGYLNTYVGRKYGISAKGWQRIEDIQRKKEDMRQGFIAMSFRDETKQIRESFRMAIQNCGYNAMAIDEKEHNNQIVPEIFHEIDNSMFLVMDVTYPNFGAYYEAGYALGKGKQVIICCRKDAFEDSAKVRPHFDIQQKSMIIWETNDELITRLEKRIKATVNK